MEILFQIPAGHMRLILAHKQTDIDTTSLQPVKWLVELVLISNKEGRNQFFNMDRINQILAPALRSAGHMTAYQLIFFPNTRELEGRPYTPPVERPTRPFPLCLAAISPRTPPTGIPTSSRPPPKDTPSSYALSTIPRYILPQRPIHLVELCGSMAT